MVRRSCARRLASCPLTQNGCVDRMHGHRQLTDLYLLALALEHGGRLFTFDAQLPLSAVRGAGTAHLLPI